MKVKTKFSITSHSKSIFALQIFRVLTNSSKINVMSDRIKTSIYLNIFETIVGILEVREATIIFFQLNAIPLFVTITFDIIWTHDRK